MGVEVKYYPEDVGKEYGSLGIQFPMNGRRGNSSSGVFNVSYTTEQQAISNYINLLLTKPGQRYMQPTYGVGLQYQVFEQNTPALQQSIELDIRQQSQYWLPYIFNRRITIGFANDDTGLSGDNQHGISINIDFSVTENGANKSMQIYLVNGITRVEVF